MTNPNPLTPLLIDLATARAEEQAAKASTALLAKEDIVQTYLGTVAETRTARQNNRAAYQQLAETAVSLYDGQNKELHPCINMAHFRTAHIMRHDVALLWLLCNATDTVDLLNTKRMTNAVEMLGKAMQVALRRRQALAIVEEIFSDVEGNPIDVITFARPTQIPKPRIARDLSDYAPGGTAHAAWQLEQALQEDPAIAELQTNGQPTIFQSSSNEVLLEQPKVAQKTKEPLSK